jgi:hypothetical protein
MKHVLLHPSHIPLASPRVHLQTQPPVSCVSALGGLWSQVVPALCKQTKRVRVLTASDYPSLVNVELLDKFFLFLGPPWTSLRRGPCLDTVSPWTQHLRGSPRR